MVLTSPDRFLNPESASDLALEVQNLCVSFGTDDGEFEAVSNVSFSLKKGKTLAIVGESGCGKSVTSLSLMKLLPANAKITQGDIIFRGKSLLSVPEHEMRSLRGQHLAMIFQEPMMALNPVYTVGAQIAEVFRIHKNVSKREALQETLKILEKVRIPDPLRRIDEYPFQMSGGMRQRILIAIALACSPDILIADEPTTALDVTIQAQILNLMRALQKEMNTAIVLVTHDLGVVAQMADDVAIMYAGRIVEYGSVYDIFERPSHPYTRGLLASIPAATSTKALELKSIQGHVPSLREFSPGCRFYDRCSFAQSICQEYIPKLLAVEKLHMSACVRQREI